MCAFNRTVSKVQDFLNKEAKGTKVIGATSLEDMVAKLKKPRRVMMLVKAGSAVDDFIDKLVSHPGLICDIEVWGDTDKSKSNLVEITQKEAIDHMESADYFANAGSLFKFAAYCSEFQICMSYAH